MRRAFLLLLLLLTGSPALAKPIQVKVVVLTTFEAGSSAGSGSGQGSGEFYLWANRMPLTRALKVPGVEGRVLLSDDGVLGVVTGMRARPRESVTALILDPALDLSHAYWIVAGIAGVDPRAGSIGSAAWARYVVDADPIFEMDDRDIPKGWSEGLWSLGASRPGVKGSAPGSSDMVWKLNPGLVAWAYGLTRDIPLPDNEKLRAVRSKFPSEPAAQAPPRPRPGSSSATRSAPPAFGTASGAPAGRATGCGCGPTAREPSPPPPARTRASLMCSACSAARAGWTRLASSSCAPPATTRAKATAPILPWSSLPAARPPPSTPPTASARLS
jgi:hypothetical protein